MSRSFDALRRAAVNETETSRDLTTPLGGVLFKESPGAESALEIKRIAVAPKRGTRIVGEVDRSNNAVREHFRYLEQQLRQDPRLKRILVTSSAPQDGKTVVSANLAATLACGAQRVLLLDADMRGPGSGALFGINGAAGLADVLEGRAELSEAMVYLEALKVHYIPAGRPSSSATALVQRGQMQSLLASLGDFDWVIVDSPPIGAFADALSMATELDGVVFVARSGRTSKREIAHSLTALKGCRIVGMVLNGYDKPQKDYYHSYYKSPAN